jgi:hypothetical protein
LNKKSSLIAQQLMRAGISARNCNMTRSVYTASFDEETEFCSFADSDICLSYFAHLANDQELRQELIEENPKPIVDWNVLNILGKEVHLALRIEEQGVELFLLPRLIPQQVEQFHQYQFVRVNVAC